MTMSNMDAYVDNNSHTQDLAMSGYIKAEFTLPTVCLTFKEQE